jgi:ribosomal protein S18 acetylase RimI-like enzyme
VDAIGLVVRDARADDCAAMGEVFVQGWRAECAGLLPDEVLQARSAVESSVNWRRSIERIAAEPDPRQCILVAVEREVIVGQVVAGAGETDGEIIALQVADNHRRRGVGGLLVRTAAARLQALGETVVTVRVLRDNANARRFYEALGGEVTPEQTVVEESGVMLPQCAYRWADVRQLTGSV